MGFVLDAILKENVMEDQIINSESFSDSVDVTFAETGYLLDVSWEDGSSLDFYLYIQVSSDDIDWVDLPNSEQQITGETGTHLYDVTDSNVNFVRVKFTPNSGSGTFNITYTAKRRH